MANTYCNIAVVLTLTFGSIILGLYILKDTENSFDDRHFQAAFFNNGSKSKGLDISGHNSSNATDSHSQNAHSNSGLNWTSSNVPYLDVKFVTSQCNLTAFNQQLRLEESEPIVPVHFLSGCHHLFYNRIPKTGSRTALQVLQRLGKLHKFRVTTTIRYIKRFYLTDKSVRDIIRQFNSTNYRLALVSHSNYHNLSPYSRYPPIYINILRDPIQRFVSLISFIKYGDDTKGPFLKNPELASGQLDDVNVCILNDTCYYKYKRRQVIQICGQAPFCSNYSERSLGEALEHFYKNYLVIGTTDKQLEFFEVMEYLMPQMFSNSRNIYQQIELGSKQRFKTKRVDQPSKETYAIFKSKISLDYKLYNAVTERFQKLLSAIRYLKNKNSDPETSKDKSVRSV